MARGRWAETTLRPAHDTDAPFAERARRPARLPRRRTRGLGTSGQRRASPDGLARQRHRHRPLRRVARQPPARRDRHRQLRTLRLRSVLAGTVERTGYVSGYDGYGQVVVLDLPRPVHGALRASLVACASDPASTCAEDSGSVSPAARGAARGRTSTSRSSGAACRSIHSASWARSSENSTIVAADAVALPRRRRLGGRRRTLSRLGSLARDDAGEELVRDDGRALLRAPGGLRRTDRLAAAAAARRARPERQPALPGADLAAVRRRQHPRELRGRAPAERVPDHLRGDSGLPARTPDRARAPALALGGCVERRRSLGRARVVPPHRGRCLPGLLLGAPGADVRGRAQDVADGPARARRDRCRRARADAVRRPPRRARRRGRRRGDAGRDAARGAGQPLADPAPLCRPVRCSAVRRPRRDRDREGLAAARLLLGHGRERAPRPRPLPAGVRARGAACARPRDPALHRRRRLARRPRPPVDARARARASRSSAARRSCS